MKGIYIYTKDDRILEIIISSLQDPKGFIEEIIANGYVHKEKTSADRVHAIHYTGYTPEQIQKITTIRPNQLTFD
jgi:hypothetical protein